MTDLLKSPVRITDLQGNLATSGVYAIHCTKSDTFYIGQSQVVLRRVVDHLTQLKENRHPNDAMQNEFSVYGEVAFEVDLVHDMPGATMAQLQLWEMKEISRFKSHGKLLYNKTGGSVCIEPPKRREKLSSVYAVPKSKPPEPRVSHSEIKREYRPAVCDDCGTVGMYHEDTFTCDDDRTRCNACIEKYLSNWKRQEHGKTRRRDWRMSAKRSGRFFRWQVQGRSKIEHQVMMAAKRFVKRYEQRPHVVYMHPGTYEGEECAHLQVDFRTVTPDGYIDIPINTTAE